MSVRPSTIEKIAGTTLRVTFVSSGNTASGLISELLTPNETMVSSCAAISSGSGFYYALHSVPNSAQWLVNKWSGVIAANTYVERQFVRVRTMESD